MINRDRIGHLRPDLLANGLQDEAGSILERMIAQPESRIEHAHHDREQFCSCSGIMLARNFLPKISARSLSASFRSLAALLFSADGDSSLLALFSAQLIRHSAGIGQRRKCFVARIGLLCFLCG